MKYLPSIAVMLLLTLVALLGGCNDEQKRRAVADGQLFCAVATASGPLVVAVANVVGAPIIVTGMASNVVASVCAMLKGIPVTPPPDQAAAPVVAVPLQPAPDNKPT